MHCKYKESRIGQAKNLQRTVRERKRVKINLEPGIAHLSSCFFLQWYQTSPWYAVLINKTALCLAFQTGCCSRSLRPT